MTPVKQDIFGDGKGNCYAACIASILDLPLSAVPNFCGGRNPNWFEDTVAWLKTRRWHAVRVAWNDDSRFLASGVLALIAGPSPRGNMLHSVVGRLHDMHWEPVHDPHPDNTFLNGDPVDFILLIPEVAA